jgi:hypothetical protein
MGSMPLLASRLGRALVPLVVAACCAFARDAAAQSKDPAAAARDLARAGWDALDHQNYKDALDKVTQAEALYHAPTHLLLMGNAQAGLGKLADALATFERLAAEPLSSAAPNAFKDAQEAGRKRMKELLSRVPSLLVVVESAEAPAATVTVDGQKVAFAGGVALRFDPGEHVIGVEAEGFPAVKKTIVLPEKGGVVRVPIALERPGASPTASATAAPTVNAGASAAPTGAGPVDAGPSRYRVPTFVTFGVAGASLVVGAVTGALSLGMTSDLKARCPNNQCSPADRGSLDSANALATTSTATFVIGGVAAVTGVVLLTLDLTASRSKAQAAGSRSATSGERLRAASAPALQIEPWISAGGAGLRGRF